MFVRSGKSPLKSSVASVSKLGNSLFTAVATSASLNWVSSSISSAKPAGMFVMFVQSGVMVDPSTENVVPVKSSPAPAVYSVLSSVLSAKPAGTAVRLPHAPSKSSVESVSKFGNSLFTAVATSASLNWVSLSISSAKPAGILVMFVQSGVMVDPSTENVVPVRSSPAPAVYSVLSSVLSAKPAGMLVMFVQSGVIVDPSTENVVPVRSSPAPAVYSVLSSVLSAKPAGTAVRLPHAPSKSSVESVSKFGNSLFTAVATSASLNWVSLSISSAKPAGMFVMFVQSGVIEEPSTENVVPVKSSPAPAL